MSLFLDGSPLAPYSGGIAFRGLGNPTNEPFFYIDRPDPGFPVPVLDAFSTSTDHVPTTYLDFALNGAPAVSGSVSAVPLPAALPPVSEKLSPG
jgi:hypothetical protein